MSKKPEKKEDNKDYSFGIDDTIEKDIDAKIKEHETKQAPINIEDLKENMPIPGYMETTLNAAIVKGKNEAGADIEERCVSFEVLKDDEDADFMEITYDADGNPKLKPDGRKVVIFDPVFTMDLREHAECQISDCASTVFPQIADEMVQLALDEKHQRGPELRKPLFNYWWIILLMIMIPVIIVTLMIVRGGGGG